MIEGASRMGDGKFEKTIYTGCFSARTGNYYYAMYGDPSIRYVSLMDAEGAITALGGITGETVTDAVVTRIFSDFCVGK